MTNGINGATGAPGVYQDLDLEALTSPAPLSTGSPEELIAQVAVQLEQAGARDADVSRQMRRSQTRANRASLDDKRKAAKLQLAAGITEASASAVQGAISIGQSSQNLAASSSSAAADGFESAGMTDQAMIERRDAGAHSARSERMGGTSSLVGAGGQAAGSVMKYFGERASIEAEEHANQAQELAQSAEAADEARESAQRFADKAMQHLGEIEEAKHRAAMAALRG